MDIDLEGTVTEVEEHKGVTRIIKGVLYNNLVVVHYGF